MTTSAVSSKTHVLQDGQNEINEQSHHDLTLQIIDLSALKVIHESIEAEYDFSVSSAEYSSIEISLSEQISAGLSRVEGEIQAQQDEIDQLNLDIDRLTNHSDQVDNLVAIGSGLLAGLIDAFWVGEFNFERGKAWSNRTVNDFVMRTAKAQGYEGERLDDAIKFLERKFPVPSDNIWKGKDLGISAKSHHLDDLAHHPTPAGLFFSILTQFTKKGYFQNGEGRFSSISIDEDSLELIGADVSSKFFCGTVNWFFHLVSDMSGSNKTAGVGMGIPGPIVSLLKELSTIPGLDRIGLPKWLKEVFVKERFDLRSEMAVMHELGRQAVPVMINEVLVRAFYFIRRFASELKAKRSFSDIDWKNTLPWNNRTMTRMLTIATGTFTAVDLADAAIRSAMKSGGNFAAFGAQLVLRVNFVGIGRFAIAVYSDVSMGFQRERQRDERIAVLSEQLHWVNAKVAYMQGGVWQAAERTEASLLAAELMMCQSVEISIRAWEANRISLRQIGQMQHKIQTHNPQLTHQIRNILNVGRTHMTETTSIDKNISESQFTLPAFDERQLPELIQGQIAKLNELDVHVKTAIETAQIAENSAKNAKKQSADFHLWKDNKKAAIEELQKAFLELAQAVQSGASAQKTAFEFQTRLAEITKYLFSLGVRNVAATRMVVRELEARLHGASEEELSELARQEILAVVVQLKEQEDLHNKQEELRVKQNRMDEVLESHDNKLLYLLTQSEDFDNKLEAQKEQQLICTDLIAKFEMELAASKKKISTLNQRTVFLIVLNIFLFTVLSFVR